MASSAQGLGEAVARELAIGVNAYVVIAAEDGLVIQQSIRNLPVVLAAQFGAGKASAPRYAHTNRSGMARV